MMHYDFDDDLAGDELDFQGEPQEDGDGLSLLLAEHPANQGAAVWE